MGWHTTATVPGDALDDLDAAVSEAFGYLLASEKEADRDRGIALELALREFMLAATGVPQIYDDVVGANEALNELDRDRPGVAFDEAGNVIAGSK